MPVGSQSYKQCAALRSSKALVSVALSSGRYMNDALLIEPIRMHGARVSALYSRGEARVGAKLSLLIAASQSTCCSKCLCNVKCRCLLVVLGPDGFICLRPSPLTGIPLLPSSIRRRTLHPTLSPWTASFTLATLAFFHVSLDKPEHKTGHPTHTPLAITKHGKNISNNSQQFKVSPSKQSNNKVVCLHSFKI